jgi:hypothetical protein
MLAADSYRSFLASKRLTAPSVGIDVDPATLHPAMREHQRRITAWALKKGRAAVFADTGLGKALIAMEWAQQLGLAGLAPRTLILAPLSVAQQFVREGEKWGIPVVYARSEAEAPATGIVTSNYERLDRFMVEDTTRWPAVVLDESSILKTYTGETKRKLIARFRHTMYRLCCTATPAPNDVEELCHHADFLGVMSEQDMKATFFISKGQDQKSSRFRLKNHARKAFYSWLASWAVAAKLPSDLTGVAADDEGYVLPPLHIHSTFVPVEWVPPGQLFLVQLKGIVERAAVRRDTFKERCAATVKIIEASWSQNNNSNTSEIVTSERETNYSLPTRSDDLNGVQSGTSNKSNITAIGTPATESRNEQDKTRNVRRGRRKKSNSDAGSDTPITSLTGSGSRQKPDCGELRILESRRQASLSGNTDSLLPTSNGLCESRMASAPSAVLPKTTREPDCISTTTMPRAVSGDYSAAGATWELDCSRIVQNDWQPPSLTSSGPPEQWIVWCGLDAEQEEIVRLLGERCISVYGSLSADEKERRVAAWQRGDVPVLVTKVSICGFGVNWQHCARQVFVGLSDSYEAYYQAIRRSWRFGQPRPVHAHIVLSEPERAVYDNVLRKEAEAGELTRELVAAMRDFERAELGISKQDTEDRYAPTRPLVLPAWLKSVPVGTSPATLPSPIGAAAPRAVPPPLGLAE